MVELPVIGEQHFGLSVTSDREAQLRLKGALDLDEPVYYNVGSDGKLRFTLSETTSRTLGRLRTTLLHAGARHTRPRPPTHRPPTRRTAPCCPVHPRPPTQHPPHDTLLPPVGPARLRPCARADAPTCPPRRVLQVERLGRDHGLAAARPARRARHAHARERRGGRTSSPISPLYLPYISPVSPQVSAEADELRAAVTSYLYSEDRRY